MKKSVVILLVFLFTFSACKQKKKVWNGDPVGNYPAMKDLLTDYFDPFIKEALEFKYIHFENGKRDTVEIKTAEMPIKRIRETFEGANIQKKELDRRYKVDFLSDGQMGAFTMLYTALAPQFYVQSMSILAEAETKDMQSLYIETDDPGFFSSKKERILLIPGNTIQIQTQSKTLFSKEKKTIETYILSE